MYILLSLHKKGQFKNATRNPQLSLKITFYIDDAEGYNKGRFTFGEPAFVVFKFHNGSRILYLHIIMYNLTNRIY